MRRNIRAAIVLILAAAALIFLKPNETPIGISASDDSALETAFLERSQGTQVSGQGVVLRVLPDDLDGDRHQRFILELSSGQTLLVSHNIDLAPRISSLENGDLIQFNGEYEWNEQGGVVHWTHHDPRGSHVDGWLIHEDRIYQ